MTKITTRQYGPDPKGGPLSYSEMDLNLLYFKSITNITSLSGSTPNGGVFPITNPNPKNFNAGAGITIGYSAGETVTESVMRQVGGFNGVAAGIIISGGLDVSGSLVAGTINAATFSGSFIGNLTGSFSGIASGAFNGTFEGSSSGIFSGTSSGIFAGTSSGIFNGTSSGIFSGTSSGLFNGTSSGIFSGTSSGIFSGTSSGLFSGTSSGLFSGTSSGIFNGTSSGVFNGTVQGTSSLAVSSSFATTASYIITAQTASFITASNVIGIVNSSYTASYAVTSLSASWASASLTSSYIVTAQTASFVNTAQTASFVNTARTASFATNFRVSTYLNVGTSTGSVTGEINASGDVIAFSASDKRLKTNIKPIEDPIKKLMQLSGNTFDWMRGFEEMHSHIGEDVGVIAQEVEEVLPQVVTTRDNGYKAVKYEKIVALLIEAVKAQQIEIDELKSRL